MRLFTPDNLHYPIKITRLLHSSGDDIAQNASLFSYEYKSKVHESTAANPEGREVERTWPARFESELEGTLENLHITEGQYITRRTHVADIEEACRHEVQFGGMCANCGKDLTVQSSYNATMKDTERATVNTVHGHTSLLVSLSEASRADEEAKRRLLDARKLILVVDLDQTVIHATVEPTIAEWQQDPTNPNHEAVKDVRAFQLIDEGPGARGCWYYIKLRPGLEEFLKQVSSLYELHIYTMATRAYAENIAKIIDPERKLFGDRILSRDENGNMTVKSLKRLFPVDTKMVVIIDDRGDVWHWSPNLIKVSVYDFFVGTGDINSSFLPKRPELDTKSLKQTKEKVKAIDDTIGDSTTTEDVAEAAKPAPKVDTGESLPSDTNGQASAVDTLISMAGKQDAESMKEKVEEQDTTLASQLTERPLLQKQKMLEAAEEEAKTSPAAAEAAAELLSESSGSVPSIVVVEPPRYRHNLLQDDDTELVHLSNSLQSVHTNFFKAYDSLHPPPPNGRQALDTIPDAAGIMRDLKSRVLNGVQLVFSGVVPLGVDIFAHDIVIWAKSFGATVSENVTKKTTHVVASPERRTAKVRQAARKGGRIRIVSLAWLMACFSQWRRVDEGPYKIHSDAEHKAGHDGGLPDSFGDEERAALSSSEDGDVATEDEPEDVIMAIETTEQIDGEGDIARDAEEDLAQYAPTTEREDSSPIDAEQPEDWDGIDAELAEFLGSEADDESDAESVRSDLSIRPKTPPSQLKRKREADDTDDSASSSGTDHDHGVRGSKLQKRKREAMARTSSLTKISGIPDTAETDENKDAGAGEDEEDDDDNLEAALAAEMSKMDDDEGDE